MTTWQVTNGQSIQAAIAGASDGDTIAVDAGVYAENLTIDKAVTILGANHGIAGTGARESETIIMGTTTVTAAGPVTIDGVEVFNTSSAGSQFIGVSVHTASDVIIKEQRLLLARCQRQQRGSGDQPRHYRPGPHRRRQQPDYR